MIDNGIRVPSGFRMRPMGFKDPDFRRACVRDFIKDHPQEIISLKQFAVAVYGSESAVSGTSRLLKSLIRQGRVSRTRVKTGKAGVRYKYVWHEQRVPKDPSRVNGKVLTRKAEAPAAASTPFKIQPDIVQDLSQSAILEFSRVAQTDSHIAGAVHFINWLRDQTGGGTSDADN